MSKSMTPFDTIIRVDRTSRPAYPYFVRDVLHPELELIGPARFDIKKDVKIWLHPKQETGVVQGNVIYNYLKDNDLLASQLGLADLRAIQARGQAFYQRHFAGQVVFGWRSVVRYRGGDLLVPCLVGDEGGVLLDWDWLDSYWNSYDPALRFAN